MRLLRYSHRVVEHLGARSILEVRVEGPNIEFKAPTQDKVHLNGNGNGNGATQSQSQSQSQTNTTSA